MPAENHGAFEDEVMDLVREMVARRTTRLGEIGYTCAVHPLRKISDANRYSSEVTIDFKTDAGIQDVVEFHIVEGGERIASVEHIAAWLEETLDDVIQRRASAERRSSTPRLSS